MQIRMEGRISHEGKEYGTYIDVTEEQDPERLKVYRETIRRSLERAVKQETMGN